MRLLCCFKKAGGSTIMAVKACTAGASTIAEVATSHTLPQAAL